MRIAVYDENLMWSSRLKLTIEAAGHTALVLSKAGQSEPADVAIVNLGSRVFNASDLVPRLRQTGTKVIAHAGHKERPLQAMGNELGCELVVSNSSITNHLVKLLNQLDQKPDQTRE
jgi:hypothetical protein